MADHEGKWLQCVLSLSESCFYFQFMGFPPSPPLILCALRLFPTTSKPLAAQWSLPSLLASTVAHAQMLLVASQVFRE